MNLDVLPPELTDASPFEAYRELEVTNDTQVEYAGQIIKEVSQRLKAIEAKRLEVVGPIKKGIAKFEALCRDARRPLEAVSESLRGKIQVFWDSRQASLLKEAQTQRIADLEIEKTKLQDAIHTAMTFDSEDALKEAQQRAKNIERLESNPVEVSQTVRSQSFTLAQSQVWKWRIADASQIPDAFWVLDEKLVNATARAYGKTPVQIPGIEFYQESKTVLK